MIENDGNRYQGHHGASYLSGRRHCTWWQTMKTPSQYFGRPRHGLLGDRPACPSPCRSRGHHPDGLALSHTKTGESHAHSQRLLHMGTLLYLPSRHRDEGPPPAWLHKVERYSGQYYSRGRNTGTELAAYMQVSQQRQHHRITEQVWGG